jgi:transcriptional regulator with XRE-family HTH domain
MHKGEKIKEMVKRSGYSAEQVAHKLGRGRTYMYKAIYPHEEVAPDLIKRIGEILVVDMSRVFPDFNPILASAEPEAEYTRLPRPQNAYDIDKMNTLRDMILDLTKEVSSWKEKYYQLKIECYEKLGQASLNA